MNIRFPLLSLTKRSHSYSPPLLPLSPHRAKSDLAVYVSHLQLCGLHGHLPKSREVHSRLLASGLAASPFAVTALISLYSRLAHPADALAVFHSTPQPNLFAWNAAVAALASNSRPADALALFRRLCCESGLRPDEFTFPCAIKACTDLSALEEIEKIHTLLLKVALSTEVFAASALTRSYLKFGRVEEAQKAFDELPERDVVLWNAMVIGFAQMGRFAVALAYFYRMVEEGMVPSKFTVTGILSVFTSTADLPNGRKVHAFAIKVGHDGEVAVSNALIDLYGKCHALDDAAEVFESMPERDDFSWNSMISASQYSADHERRLRLFHRMRHANVLPDAVTASGVLPACSQMAALSLGREVHAYMITSGMGGLQGDVFADNALVDMYAKCGALGEAKRVFDAMLARDTASWNIMIDGYASHGLGREALELFGRMVASWFAPDEVTFVGLLSACSHAGLVVAGRELLHRMEAEFGVVPAAEHYACAADMFGRAGMMEEAKRVAVVAGMKGEKAWRTYLAATGREGDGVEAAKESVVEMDVESGGSGVWVAVANAYGSMGRYEEVAAVRGEMRRRGVRKVAGCSWVEVAGWGVHGFVAGDQGHPEADNIYEALHALVKCMREC